MIYFNKKNNKNSNGFTLIETLVALFIFSVSILTVMSALSSGISSINYVKNKMIAENLAQEGIEYFRNIRDSYALDISGNRWEDFKALLTSKGCTNAGTGCGFSFIPEEVYPGNNLTIQSVPSLCIGYNYFGYISNGEFCNTIFSRRIITIFSDDEESMKVTSTVSFGTGSNSKTVSLSENLSNWAE